MSLNLLDLVKDQMSSQVIGKLSGLVGESAGSTGSALTSFIPALMGGMADKASSAEGASGLMDMFKNSAESGISDNLEGSLSGDTSELMNSGKGMLEGIMGDKLGGLTSAISGSSGMGTGALSKLMSLAGPMVMGIIGKKVMSQGMDVSGLQGLMSSQTEHINAAMPSGLLDKIGLGGLAAGAAGLAGAAGSAVTGAAGNVADGVGNVAGKGADAIKGAAGAVTGAAGDLAEGAGNVAGKGVDAVKGAAGAVGNAAGNVVDGVGDVAGAGVDAAKGGLRWLWGILPLLLLGLLAWWLLTKGCGGTVDAVKDTTSGVVNKAGDVAKKGAGAVGDVAKKGAGAVGSAAGAVGDAAKGAVDATGNAIKKGAGAVRDAAGNIKLPSGETLKFGKGSFGDKLATYLTGSGKAGQSFTIDNLNFASGSSVVPGSAKANLSSVAKLLKAYPNVVIALEGHTDSQGNAASNTKLSQARADAVKTFLQSSGVAANQIQGARGFGSVKPVASNNDAAGRAKNRRTELKIVKR